MHLCRMLTHNPSSERCGVAVIVGCGGIAVDALSRWCEVVDDQERGSGKGTCGTIRNFVRGGAVDKSGDGDCEARAEQDGELSLGQGPFARQHDPLLLGAVQDREEEFRRGLVANQPVIADFDLQCVNENQRVNRLQRPRLPRRDRLQHSIGDGADQIRRDRDVIEIAPMADDLAGAHAAGVHRDDLRQTPGRGAGPW